MMSHQTALHKAAMVGSRDGVAALIKGGCALDLQDKDGNTALHEVSWHGFSQCVKLLVKAGADVLTKNKAGNTALHLASQNGHCQSARLLLLGGSQPDSKNHVGDTCLHTASRYNQLAMIKILLGALCSVAEKNEVGDTALHVAAALNHKKTVNLLLESGADSGIRNNAGQTAVDKARDQNHREVAVLLSKADQVSSTAVRPHATCPATPRRLTVIHHQVISTRSFTTTRSLITRSFTTRSLTTTQQEERAAYHFITLPFIHGLVCCHVGHRFARARTVRKRRDQLKTARRAQSVPRDEVPAGKEITSVAEAEDSHSSDQALNKRIEMVSKAMSSPRNRRKLRRLKDRADPHARRGGHGRRARSASPPDEDDATFPDGKAYQLYTLYRDKDGKIKQAPATDCHCKPLIKKLENQLKATKMEIRSQIYSIHEEMNSKLGRMDRQSKHQIKVLQKIAQERVSVEGMECLYRINQRSTIERLNEERRQARKASELKNWCMSKIQDMDVRLPGDPQYFKLLPSPSVDQSLLETDPECLPLLSVVSEESTSSLATYVNVLPSPGLAPYAAGPGADFDDVFGRKYFEVKVDSSSEDQQHPPELDYAVPTLHLPMVRHQLFSRPRPISGDPRWLPADLQETDSSEPRADRHVGVGVDEFYLSTPSDSLSPCSRPPGGGESDPDDALPPGWQRHRLPPRPHPVRDGIASAATLSHRHSYGGGGVGSVLGARGVRSLELYGGGVAVGVGGVGGMERPAEMSFIQERDNLHAVEVTQRFFETVSTQLERWYERKISEAQRLAEQRATLDRSSLMERISSLEEELQGLRANTHT
ncbi:ankyrin repeat domain-containing protein 6 [Sardina pilchardus]|uniref:ankyrin repeat domain-containing protein 6 n=1 Tax=Sardina pilchardus TaxID=27697 RepID=UPI002E12FD1E